MRKKRILLVNEFSGLNTGYAVYGRNLFTELYKSGKYELAELAVYLDPRDPRGKQFPWRIYPGVPGPENQQLHQQYNSDPNNAFGKLLFEKIALDFKPDCVICFRDTWMERFIPESPFRPYFKWAWLATIDGLPQQSDWLNMYGETDALFTYTDWSRSVIEDYGLRVEATASPVAEPCFRPVQDKEAFKKQFGFEGVKIIGMGSRNQARKAFPDLLEVFREILNKTGRSDIYLYLHTSNQDQGWNLPEIIKQTGLSSKIIMTYVCRKCGYAFPSMYNDENCKCKKCGSQEANCSNVQIGVPSDGLAQIYNTWDICVQWATCLTGHQEILVNNKWVPIKDVKCGDIAFTHNGKWQNVTKIFKRKATNIKQFKVWSDYEKLEITEEHPILAITRDMLSSKSKRNTRVIVGKRIFNNQTVPEPKFVEIKSLKVGDLIATKIDNSVIDMNKIDLSTYCKDHIDIKDESIYLKQSRKTYNRFLDIDLDFCRFIGLFVADGYANISNAGVSITCNISESKNIKLSELVLGRINITKIYPYKNREAVDVKTSCSLLNSFFRENCYKNKEKKLPDWVLTLPIDKQKEIVIGMFIGDGSKVKDYPTSTYFTTSEILCNQLKTLLRRIGFTYNVIKIDRSKAKRKTAYRFEVYGDIKHKNEINTKINSSTCLNYNGYYFLKVKSIEDVHSQEVYNIEVENDNSYTTKIGNVHNCEGAGMVPIEAAACGVPVIEVDYSAMSDIGRKLNGELIEPLGFHKEVMTSRKMAVPDNAKLVETLIEFLNLPSSIQRLKGYEARQGFEKHYSSWNKTASVWMNWFDRVESAQPWNSPPKFHNPVAFEQIPPQLSNSEFVKVCISHVLGDTSKLFGYFHLGLLKNLNYGFLPGAPGQKQAFGRKEIHNVCVNMRNRINMWESERVKLCKQN